MPIPILLRLIMISITVLVSGVTFVQNVEAEERNNTIILDGTEEKIYADSYIEVLIDREAQYEIEDVIAGKYDGEFEHYEGKGRPNYGYDLSYFWVRLHISNRSHIEEWLLEVDAPKINELHFYKEKEGRNKLETVKTGNNHPFNEREIAHRDYVTELSITPNETMTVYAFVATGSSVQLPFTIWRPQTFYAKSQEEYSLLGGIVGLSIVMALYNLFLFFSIRDRSYLYYVIFVLLNTLLFLVDTGLSYQFIWPNKTSDDVISVTELMFLNNIAALIFIRSFLVIPKRAKKVHFAYKFLIGMNLLAFIIRQFTFTGAVYAATGLVLLSIFLILYTATHSLRKGFRPARYILIAWGFFLLGVFVSLMVDVGLIPLTFFTKYAWQMTTSLEVVLLSFALGDKYKKFREEKERAVQEANKIQEEALESFKRTDKLKDEFLAITSHELKTPLNGIIGIAETMREGVVGPLPKEMSAHLSMIVTSGKRLAHLVDDILDYSNLRNDSLRLKQGPVRLYEIINIVLTLCQPLVRNKPIALKNELSLEDGVIVYADESRLQQILYNLVGNAIKYTEEGRVVISTSLHTDFVKINITDTGKGIPEEQQDYIFEQFYQIDDNMTRDTDGAGIGLNITKQLIEKHGGTLKVESIEGEGSIFSFMLPLYKGTLDDSVKDVTPDVISQWPTEDLVLQTTEIIDGRANILIVDDDPVNLQVLMNQLSLEGYNVITANSGLEVLEIVPYEKIDLLIVDIMMPKMSGYEVCQRLRKNFTLIDLPILMLTAKTQLKDKIIAFEVGANDYLEKPCDKKELLTRVTTLIQLKRLNNELKEMNLHLEEKVQQRTEELQIANDNLEQLAESRTLLLGNIAHDLGTPVTVIYNYLQAVDRGLIEDEEKESYLQLTYSKIKILNRLIADLFDLSQLEANQLALDFRKLNMKSWLMKLKERLGLEIEQANRKFHFGSEHIDEKYYFYIDEQRIDQVFSNLMKNAINHTRSVEGEISVYVKLNTARTEVTFTVTDNGVGISESLLPFIFERYYKTMRKDDKYGGAGIGLAIVKELVHAHGGTISAESELNVGTVFYITLPIMVL